MTRASRSLALLILAIVGCGDLSWGSWTQPPPANSNACVPPQILYSCPVSVACGLGGPRTICPATCCGSDPMSAQANCLLQFSTLQAPRVFGDCVPAGSPQPQGAPVTVEAAAGVGAGGDPGAGGAGGGGVCACGQGGAG